MKSVGALAPSSKYLVHKMLKPINFNQNQKILELGPGTGVITKKILQNLNPSSELISIELNEKFCEQLKNLESENFTVLKANAENIQMLFQENSFDYIISGLPLALFKKQQVSNILNGCFNILKAEGKFIQFQYSLTNKKTLHRHFDSVEVSLATVNLPPAVVYTCGK